MVLKKSLYHRANSVLLLLLMMLVLMASHHLTVAYNTGTQIIGSSNNYAQTLPHTLQQSKKRVSKKQGEVTRISWLIVGGGIHGVHIATCLLGKGGIDPANACIIDDNESLLQKWRSRTAATGMKYLRSSAGYHLDLDKQSLRRQFGSVDIGNQKQKRKQNSPSIRNKLFSNDYERPRLDVFNQHCAGVIEKYGLDKLHVKGVVTAIEPADQYVQVDVSLPNGESIVYMAQNIVLALGNDDPSFPDWVDAKDIEKGLVHHLMDERKHIKNDGDVSDIAVVGGGITAAHKALQLVQAKKYAKANSTKKNIHLVSRHPLKEQQFDTHQDWMMDRAASKRSEQGGGYGTPKRQRMFAKCSCWKQRRMIIAQERVPGTITPAINRGDNGLCYAIEKGDIQWHQAEILNKHYIMKNNKSSLNDSGRVRMKLRLSCGETIEVDEILLATGFGKKLPGGRLVNDLVEKAGLEVSEFCGFPIVDENLSWHPRIFVAGALAELELGPSARNIAGARLAAERIIQALAMKVN